MKDTKWVAWRLLKRGGGAYTTGSAFHLMAEADDRTSGQARTLCGRRIPGMGEVAQYFGGEPYPPICSRCESKLPSGEEE